MPNDDNQNKSHQQVLLDNFREAKSSCQRKIQPFVQLNIIQEVFERVIIYYML